MIQYRSVVLTRGNVAPQGTFGNAWRLGVLLALRGWKSGRVASQYPTVHRTALHNRELSGPKCQVPNLRSALV